MAHGNVVLSGRGCPEISPSWKQTDTKIQARNCPNAFIRVARVMCLWIVILCDTGIKLCCVNLWRTWWMWIVILCETGNELCCVNMYGTDILFPLVSSIFPLWLVQRQGLNEKAPLPVLNSSALSPLAPSKIRVERAPPWLYSSPEWPHQRPCKSAWEDWPLSCLAAS